MRPGLELVPTRRTLSEKPLLETELRARLADGGRVRGAFIVARRDALGPYYVTYLSTNWRRGVQPLRSTRTRDVRSFRDLVRLVEHIRRVYGFRDPLTIYEAGCANLRGFRGILPEDQQPSAEPPESEQSPAQDGMDPAEGSGVAGT